MEGQAARHLRDAFPSDSVSVLQVFRKTAEGLALSKGFRETWENSESRPDDSAPGRRDYRLWMDLAGQRKMELILWLGSGTFHAWPGCWRQQSMTIIVSSTVIGDDLLLREPAPQTHITIRTGCP
jgi:hypothetical protein